MRHQPHFAGNLDESRRGLDNDLRVELLARYLPLDHLDLLPAPTAGDLSRAASARLGGLSPAKFVTDRRKQAAASMTEALASRVRGETVSAISAAYQADMSTLEAYLVESALAIGDTSLLLVQLRWDLAIAACLPPCTPMMLRVW